jgi:hypothetical protein
MSDLLPISQRAASSRLSPGSSLNNAQNRLGHLNLVETCFVHGSIHLNVSVVNRWYHFLC